MSEQVQQTEEKDNGMGVAGVIGGVAGGVGTLALADKYAGNAAIRKIIDPESAFNKAALDKIDKETDAAKRADLVKAHEAKGARIQEIHGSEKFTKAVADLESTKPAIELAQSDAGVAALKRNAHIEEVYFEKAGKGHVATVKMQPEAFSHLTEEAAKKAGFTDVKVVDGKLTEANFKIHNVELPKGIEIAEGKNLLKGEAVQTLHTVAEGAGKDAKSWVASTEAAFEKSANEFTLKNVPNITRKAGGIGTGLKQLSGMGKAGVAVVTIAGVAVGAKVVHSVFGGKHSDQVAAERAAPAAAAGHAV